MSYIGEMIENAEKGIPLDISNKPGKEYAPELVKNVTDGLRPVRTSERLQTSWICHGRQ